MIGRKFGHYVITGKLGAGGMGEVYRAHDEQLDRDVALKVLPAGVVGDEAARKQFRKEALALARLNHPNIETIFEFGSEGNMDFLAMELVPGKALDEILCAGPLPEAEIIRLGSQFADGLAAAHDQGIIHRDLKPGNLFVTPDGRVKILDFGLAKLLHPELTGDVTRSVTVQSGSISGTVPYMSPEQLRGLPVDARSDIYGAGAVLYEMASGHRPFPQTQTAELMGAILLQPLPPVRTVNPNVSVRMERVISKALDKEPAQRFQTARELKAALQSAAMSATVNVTPAEAEAQNTRILAQETGASGGAAARPGSAGASGANSGGGPLGGSAAGWAAQVPPGVPGSAPPTSVPPQSGAGVVAGQTLPMPHALPVGQSAQGAKPGSKKLVIAIMAIFFVVLAVFAAGIFGAREWIMKQLSAATARPESSSALPRTAGNPPPAQPATPQPAKPQPGTTQPNGNAGGAAAGSSPASPKAPTPPDPEAALSLAQSQIRGGKAREALATLDALRNSGAADPRVDDIAAQADEALGLYKAEQAAAASAVSHARASNSDAALAGALLRQAWALAMTGQSKDAIAAAGESQKIFTAAGDAAHVAAGARVAATLFAEEGNLGGAKSKFEQALAAARQAGDNSVAGQDLYGLARVQTLEGDLSGAKKSADDAVTACRTASDRYCESFALAVMADAQYRRGNLPNALDIFQQSLAITKDDENSAAQLQDFVGLSRVLYMQGDWAGAKAQLDAASRGLQDSGDAFLAAEAQLEMGRLLKAANQLDDARKNFEGAMNAFTNLGAKHGATVAQVEFAGVLVEWGKPTGVDAPFERAAAEFQSEGDRAEEARARTMLARALLAMGAPDKNMAAQKQVNAAIPLVSGVQDPQPRLELIAVAARAAAALGSAASAGKTLEGALSDAQRNGYVPIEFEIRLAMGEIEMKSGKADAGRTRLAALQKEAGDKGFLLMANKAQAAASK
ncbi:MAG TPA: protein kinase [Candidatus Acidoferrales bacterium]|nr:protein kinase [Candidatus Acidoferrales bacterium]